MRLSEVPSILNYFRKVATITGRKKFLETKRMNVEKAASREMIFLDLRSGVINGAAHVVDGEPHEGKGS